MLEQLDYLIRTLTYKRSCLELDLKKLETSLNIDNYIGQRNRVEGQIYGLQIALTEIYKMVMEQTKYEDNE